MGSDLYQRSAVCVPGSRAELDTAVSDPEPTTATSISNHPIAWTAPTGLRMITVPINQSPGERHEDNGRRPLGPA